MRIVPYINFAGQAEEALHFYAKALGGKVGEIMRFSEEMFPEMTDTMKDWVMHAELEFKDSAIYISDTFEPENIINGNNYTIHVDCDSTEEIYQLFDTLKEGGTVTSELEDTFWNSVYGSLTDKYGIQWSLNYQKA
jgi:PhnB protein